MDASVATANIEANCIPEPNTGCWLSRHRRRS